jgi:hypothetical protein
MEDLAQQVDGLIPLLGPECGQRLVVELLQLRSGASVGNLQLCQRLSTAAISRLVSNVRGLISTAFRRTSGARVGGNSFACGIRASSTRIGITRISRVSAVSISRRT